VSNPRKVTVSSGFGKHGGTISIENRPDGGVRLYTSNEQKKENGINHTDLDLTFEEYAALLRALLHNLPQEQTT